MGLQVGGPSPDTWMGNTHYVPTNDKPHDIKAKAKPLAVTGERQEGGEEETYIEVRGPSGLGSKTTVPYSKVLPQYRKQAERAIQRQEIPKQHQKRVRDYFNSLEGGR